MNAGDVYIDPSALARLYIHQAGSRETSIWLGKVNGALTVTHHGRIEIINAISRTVFLGYLTANAASEALADFASDFNAGRLRQADILWRSALNLAAELGQEYTPKLGTPSLVVLHVACAVELKSRYFLTFDLRQRKLASAVGLKTVEL